MDCETANSRNDGMQIRESFFLEIVRIYLRGGKFSTTTFLARVWHPDRWYYSDGEREGCRILRGSQRNLKNI